MGHFTGGGNRKTQKFQKHPEHKSQRYADQLMTSDVQYITAMSSVNDHQMEIIDMNYTFYKHLPNLCTWIVIHFWELQLVNALLKTKLIFLFTNLKTIQIDIKIECSIDNYGSYAKLMTQKTQDFCFKTLFFCAVQLSKLSSKGFRDKINLHHFTAEVKGLHGIYN